MHFLTHDSEIRFCVRLHPQSNSSFFCSSITSDFHSIRLPLRYHIDSMLRNLHLIGCTSALSRVKSRLSVPFALHRSFSAAASLSSSQTATASPKLPRRRLKVVCGMSGEHSSPSLADFFCCRRCRFVCQRLSAQTARLRCHRHVYDQLG